MHPELANGIRQITEEDLTSSGPGVRFLLVQRLESMWLPLQRALDEAQVVVGMPVDPRLLEIGLRIVKELSLLYRLQKPPVAGPEEDESPEAGVDRAAVVLAQIQELEAKLRAPAATPL